MTNLCLELWISSFLLLISWSTIRFIFCCLQGRLKFPCFWFWWYLWIYKFLFLWAVLLEISCFSTHKTCFLIGRTFSSIVTSLAISVAGHDFYALPFMLHFALFTPPCFTCIPILCIVGVRFQEFSLFFWIVGVIHSSSSRQLQSCQQFFSWSCLP